MTPVLEIATVTRRFGGLVAIDEVTTAIAPGEIRGIIGPNGAGKTTLLNIMSGHMRPSSGRVLFAGRDITKARADKVAAMGVRRTFQNVRLFGEMTVLGNVLVGLHANGRAGIFAALLRTGRQRREEHSMIDTAMQALERVGLAAQANTIASSLAYGHRKVLEIARAIVAAPKVLLLDEPAAGLNASEAANLIGVIRRINAEGVTVAIVEHHMEVIMKVCSRITVLNYGKHLAEGTPAEVQGNAQVIEAYLGRGGVAERIMELKAAHA
ncbi:MAG: ABC transporter ATP-binding protein [Betaproteobacteria bacterium]|nr:ABC transporter ATP-binding protein [Betaproteobacteria bacterium]